MQRVLLVERDPTLREWFRLHLAAQGLLVVALDDGRRALEAARSDPPDLLLIATDLPAADAFALAAAIRSDVRTALIPILFLVPANEPVTLAQAISIEPQGVLTKPLTRAVLLESVAARLGAMDASSIRGTLRAPSQMSAGSSGGAMARGAAGSGLLLDAREASVLVAVLRNFVSLARALSAKTLDTLLREFLSAARQAVIDQGGWIVRADATGLLALFEAGPRADRTHAARAIESALAVVLAGRKAKKWAQSALPNASVPDLSVGCGVHAGEVIIARLSGSGHSALTVAGQTADLAQRLDGRAKGLGWGIAVSQPAASLAGPRFHTGRKASLTDTDYGVTIAVLEVLGFNPASAKPGELPGMAEIGEAVLANTMLAKLAGDVDPLTADRTIMVSAKRPARSESLPELPQRRVQRKIGHGRFVDAYAALYVPTDREEVVKTLRLRDVSQAFIDRYLHEYREIAGLDQRNIVTVFETGQTADLAFVAMEFLPGGSLADAIRNRLPVGLALNCLAQMCLAIDAIHGLGFIHGALRSRHFLFRGDGVPVLADFNTAQRVGASLGLIQPQDVRSSREQKEEEDDHGTRADFIALGRIFHEMVTGETSLTDGAVQGESTEDLLIKASRLPLPLSPLQRCLDGLLGIGSAKPFARAEDVLVGLLELKEVFPFDIRHSSVESTAPAKKIG